MAKATGAGTILSRIKEEEIDWSTCFTDPKGKWQHFTMASGVIDEDMLTDGFMFDGSSIAGWKAMDEFGLRIMSGLVDRLPPGDRAAVEHEAVGQHVLVDHARGHGQMLPFALGIGEAKVDPVDLLFLDPRQDRARAGCLRHVALALVWSSPRTREPSCSAARQNAVPGPRFRGDDEPFESSLGDTNSGSSAEKVRRVVNFSPPIASIA